MNNAPRTSSNNSSSEPKSISKWWYAGIVVSFFTGPFMVILIPALAWLMPEKTRSTTWLQRLKAWKTYWGRSLVTGAALVLTILSVASVINMESSTPATLEILSSQGHQENATDYTVQVKATGHNQVIINGIEQTSADGTLYETTIPFREENLDIHVLVYNKQGKRTEEQFTVTRNPIEAPQIISEEIIEIAELLEEYTLTFT